VWVSFSVLLAAVLRYQLLLQEGGMSPHTASPEKGISSREFAVWAAAIGVAVVPLQWAFLTFMNGTGFPSFPAWATFVCSTLSCDMVLGMLHMVSRSHRDVERRRREFRGSATPV